MTRLAPVFLSLLAAGQALAQTPAADLAAPSPGADALRTAAGFGGRPK